MLMYGTGLSFRKLLSAKNYHTKYFAHEMFMVCMVLICMIHVGATTPTCPPVSGDINFKVSSTRLLNPPGNL